MKDKKKGKYTYLILKVMFLHEVYQRLCEPYPLMMPSNKLEG